MKRSLILGSLAVSLGCGCQPAPQSASAGPSRSDKAPEPRERLSDEQPTAAPLVLPREVLTPHAGAYRALVAPRRASKDLTLASKRVDSAPAIDGMPDDRVWSEALETVTLDRSSQRAIHIKSVHTEDDIFMRVSFPAVAASESHKSWAWDDNESVYKQGPDREDMFVLKWSMVGNDVDLSLFDHPEPHRADIWFWKARRTNPVGYADDKMHILGTNPEKKARPIPRIDGPTLYLQRKADAGVAAYEEHIAFDYAGDVLARYRHRQPTGSRADVRAVGRWSDGRWTLEFARKLDTGNGDDIRLTIGQRYLLGVSCYEMSFDEPMPALTQPLYRTGDVFDRILLLIDD